MYLQAGKRRPLSLAAASGSGTAPSRRLFVTDRLSKLSFLMDTGAEVSAIPPTNAERLSRSATHDLVAANGSPIKSWGFRMVSVDLGLRRLFHMLIRVADVTRPILGADFLYKYNLTPDLRNKRLVDLTTGITSSGSLLLTRESTIHLLSSPPPANEFEDLLKQFPSVLEPASADRPVRHSVVHRIETHGQPCHAMPRRLNKAKYNNAKAAFDTMLDLGIVRRSNSNFSSALHMAPKDQDDWRPCGDYRVLNSRTKPDRYPIPNMQDFAINLKGCTVFTKMDLDRGYHQIPMAPEDVHKTAVTTPFGLFEYLRMPFGLRNAAQTFQRFMDEVTRGLPFVFAYIDDLLVASPDSATHKQHVRAVLQRFHDYGIVIKKSKCVFGVASLSFLGHVIDRNGIAPHPDKVSAVNTAPEPRTAKGLRRFLGQVTFYHRFVPKAAHIMAPLTELLKGGSKDITWTDAAREAFVLTKKALANAALLHHPSQDSHLVLTTDASNNAIGAALNEAVRVEGHEPPAAGTLRPLAFFSRKLSAKEGQASAFDRELLAAFSAVRHFRHWLEGRNFTLLTDHKPLTFSLARTGDKYTPRQLRQLDYISQFTSDIRHIKGLDNVVADALSRQDDSVDALDSGPTTRESTLDLSRFEQEQAADDELQLLLQDPRATGLKLEQIPSPVSQGKVWADTSTGVKRIFVPASLRRDVFNSLHNLSHPGRRATLRLISDRFVWPLMNRDSKTWARSCLECQRCKISRHTASSVSRFPDVDRRFEHVHIDLVGPLPESNGFKYLLTCIDRYTRWPEVIPIKDTLAETVAESFVAHWVSRFGCPDTVTTDRGPQFESRVFRRLAELIGTNRIRTTAYHAASNGMIERLHRTLKSAITTHATAWTQSLPFVLLGIRSAFKSDVGCSSAELVYGTKIRLPADLVAPIPDSQTPDPSDFVDRLKATMQSLAPVPTRPAPSTRKAFVHPDLASCTHVWRRIDSVRRPLTAPYDGPFRVVNRDSKVFTIMVNEKPMTVSVDCLKPAFIESRTPSPDEPDAVPAPAVDTPLTLRSGRRVRFDVP